MAGALNLELLKNLNFGTFDVRTALTRYQTLFMSQLNSPFKPTSILILLVLLSSCANPLFVNRKHRKGFHFSYSESENKHSRVELTISSGRVARMEGSSEPNPLIHLSEKEKTSEFTPKKCSKSLALTQSLRKVNRTIVNNETSLFAETPNRIIGKKAQAEKEEEKKEVKGSVILATVFAILTLLCLVLMLAYENLIFILPLFSIITLVYGVEALIKIFVFKHKVSKKRKYTALAASSIGLIVSIFVYLFWASFSLF